MKLGRKIFYDNVTGLQIVDTGQWDNAIRDKTVDEEIASYPSLSERNRDTFDVLELPYGAYQQEFSIATGYRVNVETKELEFVYPNPNEPEIEQPYLVPFSEEIANLKDENSYLFYDSMMKDSKIMELEDTTSILAYESVVKDSIIAAQDTAYSDLMYTLMMNGGI